MLYTAADDVDDVVMIEWCWLRCRGCDDINDVAVMCCWLTELNQNGTCVDGNKRLILAEDYVYMTNLVLALVTRCKSFGNTLQVELWAETQTNGWTDLLGDTTGVERHSECWNIQRVLNCTTGVEIHSGCWTTLHMQFVLNYKLVQSVCWTSVQLHSGCWTTLHSWCWTRHNMVLNYAMGIELHSCYVEICSVGWNTLLVLNCRRAVDTHSGCCTTNGGAELHYTVGVH